MSGSCSGFAESPTQGFSNRSGLDLVVFSILIAFMIFRPQGLLGRADIQEGMSRMTRYRERLTSQIADPPGPAVGQDSRVALHGDPGP